MRPRGMNFNVDAPVQGVVGIMVLLDRSGSMTSVRESMEAGFAEFLGTQQQANPNTWLTLHQFDGDGYDVVYDKTPIAGVTGLRLQPRGSTPLKTSLMRFAQDARKVIDDPLDPTERLLMVIITDGENTDPSQYTWKQISETMQGLESTDSEVIWMGTSAAIMEAEENVQQFSQVGATVQFDPNDLGTVNYAYTGFAAAAASFTTSNVGAKSAMRSYQSKVGASASRADLKKALDDVLAEAKTNGQA